MLPNWYISAIDAVGLSGGLAVLWDPRWINAKAYSCLVGILISAHVRGLKCRINILNIYAPFRNKSDYWDRLFASEVFDIDSLLVAGDMNITFSSDEIWGKGKKVDPIAPMVRNEFLMRNFIDILPSTIIPT